MKILHISTSSSGGAGIAATRLHLGLLKQGIDSHILYLDIKSELANSHEFAKPVLNLFLKILKRLKLYRTKSEKNKLITSSIAKNKTMFSFAESDFDITQNEIYRKADIINLHWVSEFIDYPSFFKDNTKKIVWTLHDQNPFTGGCHYAQDCTTFKSDCNNCPVWADNTNMVDYIKKNLSIKIKSLIDVKLTVVTPSKWLLDQSSQSSLLGKFNHYHIPNGLDTEIFKNQKKDKARSYFKITTNKKVLLFISDKLFEERKGFNLLKKALVMLNRKDILLLAVGTKKDSKDTLNVHYTGHISDDEKMVAAYNAADAFILPSLEDNLPNTMLEALSCGIPLIGFRAGGIGECIKTGENGILADENSASGLAKAIDEFLSNKYKFSNELIRNKAYINFNQQKQAISYLTLYKELLNEKYN